MQKLTLVLVVALLGVAGWQLTEIQSLRQDLDTARGDQAALQQDVDRLTRRGVALAGDEAPPALVTTAPGEAPAAGADTTPGPRLIGDGASPEVLARAVRDLQSRVHDQQERVAAVEKKVDPDHRPARMFRAPKMIRSIDDAVSTLDLDGRQQGEIERIVDYAKRDLEDLHDIPNDEGKTWKEVSKMRVTSGDGDFSVVMSNVAEMMKFRNTRIPGSDETFGQADERIRRDAKKEIRDVLNDDQKKTWDDAYPDALFGAGGNSTSIVSFTTSTTTTTSSDDD